MKKIRSIPFFGWAVADMEISGSATTEEIRFVDRDKP